jgi:excisionase family DNA binding protein
MTPTQFKNWLTARLSELEPRIGEPPGPEWAAIVAEAKHYCYALGFHDFALSLPDAEKVKTPLTAANQLRRCLAMLDSPPAVPDSDVLDPPDVASLLGCSPDTVRDWIRSGQLRASNVANGNRPRWKIQRSDLETFLQTRQPDPAPPQRERRRNSGEVIEFF